MNLQRTPRVAGDAEGRTGAGDKIQLALGQQGRHSRLRQIIRSRRPATHIALRQRQEDQTGNSGEKRSRGGGHFLRVSEMTGIVIRDGLMNRMLHLRQSQFLQHFGNIAHPPGKFFGAIGVVGVIAKEQIIFPQHGPAPGDIGGDPINRRTAVRQEGVDVPPCQVFGGLVGPVVMMNRAAADLGRWRGHLRPARREKFDGHLIDAVEQHRTDAPGEKADAEGGMGVPPVLFFRKKHGRVDRATHILRHIYRALPHRTYWRQHLFHLSPLKRKKPKHTRSAKQRVQPDFLHQARGQ